jgi:hypothetical protein
MRKIKKTIIFGWALFAWILALLFLQFTFPGFVFQAIIYAIIPGNDLVSIIVLAVLCISILVTFLLLRRKVVIGIIAFFFVGLIPLNGSLWFLRDNLRNERMVNAQSILEKLRSENKLPMSLSETPNLQKLQAGPFGVDRIWYKKDGNNFIIRSYSVPVGPFELYSSNRAEWYFEE